MNRKVIIAVVIVGGAGIVDSIGAGKPLTPVILGSYIFLFMLGIMDMFGGFMSSLAGALAMLAVVYVLVGVDPTTGKTVFPWTTIINALQGKNSTTTTTTPTQPITGPVQPIGGMA